MLWWKEGSWGDSGKRRRQGRKEEQYLFILLLKPKISGLFILPSEGGNWGEGEHRFPEVSGKKKLPCTSAHQRTGPQRLF